MSLTATAFLCYGMASILKIMSCLPRENHKGLHKILQLQHLPKLRVAQTWVWDCRAGKGTEPPTLDWSMVSLSLMIAYMFFPLSSPTLLPGLSWAWPLVWFLLVKPAKWASSHLLTMRRGLPPQWLTSFPLVPHVPSCCMMMYLGKLTAEHREIWYLVTWKCWVDEGRARVCVQPTGFLGACNGVLNVCLGVKERRICSHWRRATPRKQHLHKDPSFTHRPCWCSRRIGSYVERWKEDQGPGPPAFQKLFCHQLSKMGWMPNDCAKQLHHCQGRGPTLWLEFEE